MGSDWSKIKKAVEMGDETKVLDIYQNNADIQSKLNANAIINEQTLDTFMHLSARHGMIEFMKLLLNRNHGDPNKLNRRKQTVLHKICQGSRASVQHDCMKLLMEWRDLNQSPSPRSSSSSLSIAAGKENGATPEAAAAAADARSFDAAAAANSSNNKNAITDININLKDELENTPLHYAAMNNLFGCVQVLITNGAYLFVENIEHSTPVDLAEKYGHKEIALFLESKMLFSTEEEEKDNQEEIEHDAILYDDRQNFGLRIQDLQEEKDKLLVETADMLRCNIFTAEILLKKHCWSKVSLLNAWMEDPVKCFEKCGILPVLNESEPKLYKISDSATGLGHPLAQSDESDAGKTGGKPTSLASLKGQMRAKYERASMTAKSSTLREAQQELASQLLKDPTGLKLTNKARLVHSLKLKRSTQPAQPAGAAASSIEPGKLTKANSKFCSICLNEFGHNFKENNVFSINSDQQKVLHDESIVKIACGHLFCKSCWQMYLTIKIDEGNVCDIICPQVNCFTIVPHDVVERLISKETSLKYLQFDLKAFVDSNPEIKWCPFPGCCNAVRNPNVYDSSKLNEPASTSASTEQTNQLKDYARAVDCGSGHYFCWDCLQEGHEPASCKNWKDWFQKVAEIRPEELRNTNEKAELSANYLWLVTNSKRCPNPNCNAPIQKNEGCNHVKCYRCKHDFCWICMEPWKKHSSLTGGYFQCNRYEVSNKIIQKERAIIAEAEEQHYKTVELNKFVHYYTRFKNHENSYKIEEPLLDLVKSKFESLVNQNQVHKENENTRPAELNVLISSDYSESRNSVSICDENQALNPTSSSKAAKEVLPTSSAAPSKPFEYTAEKLDEIVNVESTTTSGGGVGGTATTESKEAAEKASTATVADGDKPYLFIEEAIRELLKARRILRCSYVYGYYLDTFGHKKFIFEFIQTEFEECTENLSQIIARPHLKTPKHKIIRLTNTLRRKRFEFIDTITRGLNSFNDTPPTLKKYSRQRWKFLLKDNIQNDDEFKNAVAISLRELNPKNPWIVDKKGRHTNLLALLNDWPELEQELDSILVPSKEKNGHCANQLCGNAKAINTLSGSLCNYCSIKCMRHDRNAYLEQKQVKSEPTDIRKSVSLDKSGPSRQMMPSSTRPSESHHNFSTSHATASFNKDEESTTRARRISNKLIEEDNNRLRSNDNDFDDESSRFEQQLIDINTTTTSSLLIGGSASPAPVIVDVDAASSSEGGPPATSAAKTTTTTTTTTNVALLPYNSLFITANELDIGIIMKNLESIIYEKNTHDKTAKVCNFEIKSK